MCSLGLLDVNCIVVSVVVGFRYVFFYVRAISVDCEVEKIDLSVGFKCWVKL